MNIHPLVVDSRMLGLIILILGGVFLLPPSIKAQNGIPEVKIAQLTPNIRLGAPPNFTLSLVPVKDPGSPFPKHLLTLTKFVAKMSIECKSHRPVKWTYSGYAVPLQLNVTAHRGMENGSDVFIAELLIYRVSSQLTGTWSCQLIENDKSRNVISIFAEEYKYRGADPYFLQYGKTRDLFIQANQAEVLIPCPSYNRSVKAKLARKLSNDGVSIYQDVDEALYTYDPSEGFRLRLTPIWFGKYVCYITKNKTFDKVTVNLREKIDVQFTPNSQNLEIVEGETLSVSCQTNDSRLQVEIIPSDPRIRTRVSQKNKSASVSLPNVAYEDEGTIECHAVHVVSGRIVVTHTWKYSVIGESDKKRRGWGFYFSQRLQEYNHVCWAKSSNVPLVSYVQCTNPMECDIRGACFALKTGCDATESVLCPGGCVRIPNRQTSGRLLCVADGLEEKGSMKSVFIGVSGTIMSDENITLFEKSESLFASAVDGNVTYEGSVTKLICKASSFKFAHGLYWNVKLKSGKSIRLDANSNSSDAANLLDNSETFNSRNGIITMKSLIQILSADVSQINCIAPHWDSLSITDFPLNFEVLSPTPPYFVNSDEEEIIELSLGETSFRLTCDADGIPKPKVHWKKENSHLPNSVVLEDENATLLFQEVAYGHGGSYFCTAENPGGINVKMFQIDVSDSKNSIILGITIPSVIFILILFIVLALFWRRIQRQKKMLRNLTDAEIEEFLYGNPSEINMYEDTNRQGHLLAYNRDYEFPKDYLDIKTEEKLGSGAFGLVLKGIAKGIYAEEEETVVAIKTLQPNADITHFKSLLIELKIMSYIGRCPYIINLLGACTTDIRKREVFIVVEFCENGSLDKFLKSHRGDFVTFEGDGNVRYSMAPQRMTAFYENQPGAQPLRISLELLVKWSREIACGMEYLASKKVIHGDLASRNVLLTEQLFAKIGDFGLSRQLYEYSNYVKKQQGPLPWRWMAIESLIDMEFSHKSDVWSYGITLFEIFSLGEIPFPGLNWTEDFMKKLRQGNRPPKPDLADDIIYNTMVDCWRYVPADRPTFTELKTFFENYLTSRNIILQQPPEPPKRKKFELEITNENYGISRDKIEPFE